ncbi:MAG: type II secretion system F family protein [Paracoccaceae bacterium]
MLETLEALSHGFGLSVEMFVWIGVGLGAMLLFFGLFGAIAQGNPELERMKRQSNQRRATAAENGILRHAASDPKGLMKSLIPTDSKERTDVQRQLEYAGINSLHSVRNYYLVRLCFGVLLPVLTFVAIFWARAGVFALPENLDQIVTDWGDLQVLQLLSVMVAIGFFGPVYWLRARAAKRKQAIQEHFPNALDLIQISVEAGLGFDAAMIRVGNELTDISPEISHEFLTAQREIHAGRSRDGALIDMANRSNVEEVRSFSNTVLQSLQFGTSISETLTNYAKEMRLHRELKAQEKANKLPVQMSAVLASIMLPALILITLGPVIIRYVRFFAA